MQYSLLIPESLWANLGSSSILTAVVPVVLGGVLAYFKPWLPSEDDVRNRSNLKRQVLLEEANKRLQQLLARLQDVDFELTDLRGAPPQQPDLIADYNLEFFKAIESAQKVDRIYRCIKFSNTMFLGTVAFGLISLLSAFLLQGSRPYV